MWKIFKNFCFSKIYRLSLHYWHCQHYYYINHIKHGIMNVKLAAIMNVIINYLIIWLWKKMNSNKHYRQYIRNVIIIIMFQHYWISLQPHFLWHQLIRSGIVSDQNELFSNVIHHHHQFINILITLSHWISIEKNIGRPGKKLNRNISIKISNAFSFYCYYLDFSHMSSLLYIENFFFL